jgi:molybdopterin molybdotransferase
MTDHPVQHPNTDVRMRGFASRATVDEALAWLDRHLEALPAETVDLSAARGRVLASEVVSGVNVPSFPRAMMDGFAVQAHDTQGASAYNPLPLGVIGQALPGSGFSGRIERGQAVRIMTGAPLPEGADSVLPAERVEIQDDRILAQGEVSPGKHVGTIGEDVQRGAALFQPGRALRPQDIGVLSSIGVGEIQVVRRPHVRLVVTGDELLPAGSKPDGFQISDANSPMLAALVERDGGIAIDAGIIPDNRQDILAALQSDADVVLASGGSSVGQEDHVPTLLAEHGELAIHGIAMRPSSPAGMGTLDERLVFLLPGNPVSCLCAYDFFAGRAIRALGGQGKAWPYPLVRLPLRRKLVSAIGRVDYARVAIVDEEVEPLAISGASILSSTTRADGFVIVPADSEGYAERSAVDVFLYDLP